MYKFVGEYRSNNIGFIAIYSLLVTVIFMLVEMYGHVLFTELIYKGLSSVAIKIYPYVIDIRSCV